MIIRRPFQRRAYWKFPQAWVTVGYTFSSPELAFIFRAGNPTHNNPISPASSVLEIKNNTKTKLKRQCAEKCSKRVSKKRPKSGASNFKLTSLSNETLDYEKHPRKTHCFRQKNYFFDAGRQLGQNGRRRTSKWYRCGSKWCQCV